MVQHFFQWKAKLIAIRQATLDDASPLAQLVSQLGYPTNAAEFQHRLEAILGDPDYQTFVATEGSRVLGLIGVRLGFYYESSGVSGQIMALVVDQDHRGQGVGKALVAKVEAWLVERGARRVAVSASLHRHDAHHFYAGLGYMETGKRFAKDLAGRD